MSTKTRPDHLDPNWYKIGEDLTLSGLPVYNLRDPSLSDSSQPDTYGGLNWRNCTTPNDDNDSCWIHHNSGVPNKMFYLFAVGGMHNEISVTGIGIDSAMKVIYEAQEQRYWDDSTTFVWAMYGSLRAAWELDPSGISGSKYRELLKAWEAVKVCVPNGDVDDSGGPPDFFRDVSIMLGFIFLGGPADQCAADLNCSGTYTPADMVVMLNMVFKHTGTACPYTS